VLDAFKGHLTLEVTSAIHAMNSDLVVIPGGLTSQLQVLDVIVNKLFKDNVVDNTEDWFCSLTKVTGLHML
jgi:hypothetical protein